MSNGAVFFFLPRVLGQSHSKALHSARSTAISTYVSNWPLMIKKSGHMRFDREKITWNGLARVNSYFKNPYKSLYLRGDLNLSCYH